ncbi:hypothetical protein SISNIDRAFT_480747 [Sistotremastrum niveocremeum HHB9708]|uniref:Uncharacterized protein n=1 Tax=Sistotremastrum niveocremeum HHB9708 TaxID=1314777 RepID=A0A165AKS7_9AGAM|nr:hypothetical protein SISNIDRAFT_480747 [Sistotremastrum niveocremeum HHB9708]
MAALQLVSLLFQEDPTSTTASESVSSTMTVSPTPHESSTKPHHDKRPSSHTPSHTTSRHSSHPTSKASTMHPSSHSSKTAHHVTSKATTSHILTLHEASSAPFASAFTVTDLPLLSTPISSSLGSPSSSTSTVLLVSSSGSSHEALPTSTSTGSSSDNAHSHKPSWPTGQIIGVSVIIILVTAIAAFLLWLFCRRNPQAEDIESPTMAVTHEQLAEMRQRNLSSYPSEQQIYANSPSSEQSGSNMSLASFLSFIHFRPATTKEKLARNVEHAGDEKTLPDVTLSPFIHPNRAIENTTHVKAVRRVSEMLQSSAASSTIRAEESHRVETQSEQAFSDGLPAATSSPPRGAVRFMDGGPISPSLHSQATTYTPNVRASGEFVRSRDAKMVLRITPSPTIPQTSEPSFAAYRLTMASSEGSALPSIQSSPMSGFEPIPESELFYRSRR